MKPLRLWTFLFAMAFAFIPIPAWCGATDPSITKLEVPYKIPKIQPPEELAVFRAFVDLYMARIFGPFYADASRKFGKDQQPKLHQIIVERELSLAATKQGGLGANEQREATQKIRQIAAKQIEKELGAGVLEAFNEYENSLRLQQTLNLINQTLLLKGAPLDLKQYEYALALLQRNIPKEKWIDYTERQIGEYVAQRKEFHAGLLEEAKSTLSPVQIVELKLEFDLEERQMPYYALRNSQAKSMAKSEGVDRP